MTIPKQNDTSLDDASNSATTHINKHTPMYEPDDGPLTDEVIRAIKQRYPQPEIIDIQPLIDELHRRYVKDTSN